MGGKRERGSPTIHAIIILLPWSLSCLVNCSNHDIQWSVRSWAHSWFVGQDIPKSRRPHGRDQPTTDQRFFLSKLYPLPFHFTLLSSARNIHPFSLSLSLHPCLFTISTLGLLGKKGERGCEGEREENGQPGQAGKSNISNTDSKEKKQCNPILKRPLEQRD